MKEHPFIEIEHRIEKDEASYSYDDNTVRMVGCHNYPEDFAIALFIHELNHWAHFSELSENDMTIFNGGRFLLNMMLNEMYIYGRATMEKINETYAKDMIERAAWWGTDYEIPYMTDEEKKAVYDPQKDRKI